MTTCGKIYDKIIVSICLSVLAIQANGQTYLFNQGSFAVGAGLGSVAVGDFNRDGKPDVAALNMTDGTVSILLGKPDGTFLPQVVYNVGSLSNSLIMGDFNGDGKLDLAVAMTTSSTVEILLGNGDGTFASPQSSAVAGPARQMAAGDFNGDGRMDLAVSVETGSGFTGAVSILLGNGDGTFHLQNSIQFSNAPGILASVDLNNDGKMDLVIAGGASNALSVLLGNGNGTFKAEVDYPINGAVANFVVADFNHDGFLDVVTPNTATAQSGALMFLGKGDGTFQTPVPVMADGNSMGAMLAEDFNGDGKLDIAFGTTVFTSNVIDVLIGNGDGTFQSQPLFGGTAHSLLAMADFNLDGTLDLAYAVLGGNTKDYVGILLGNGDGTFSPRKDIATSAAPAGAITGDFNGDGKQDLAVVGITGQSSPGTVSIFLGNGDGTFQPAVDYAVGDFPQNIIADDFNGDGHLDLAIANWGSTIGQGSISILLGNGDGTFQSDVEYPVGVVKYGLVAGDFNGDGKLDIAVASGTPTPSVTETAVATLLGNGNGTFRSLTQTSIDGSSNAAHGITAADFNHDGKLDLAFTDYSSFVYVALGNGNGTFATPVSYVVPWEPSAIATADFNRDGNLDLAVAQQNSGTGSYVSIMTGKDDGTFNANVPYLTGAFPNSIAIADFNSDGKLDIATANVNGASASVLAGKGDGTFANHRDFVTTAYPLGVAAGDFNGDGSADLVTANGYSNSISIFLSHPVIALYPSQIAFPTEGTGDTSPAELVNVSNPGSAPLAIASIGVTAPFSQTNTCGSTLAIGASCTLDLFFAPVVAGDDSGVVTLVDNAPSSPQTISLSGKAINVPRAVLSPSKLDFSGQAVGTTSASQSVTLSNTGTASLAVSSIVASANFKETNNCGTTLAINASCTVNVSFSPATAGASAGTLTVTDNNDGKSGATQTVVLTGTGQDFSMAVASGSSGSVTVAPGSTASFTLALAPKDGFSQSVSFVCTGAPSGASCSISPNPVTVGSTPTDVTVNVSTSSTSEVSPRLMEPPLFTSSVRWEFGFAGVVLLVVWVKIVKSREQSRLRSFALLSTGLLLVLALAACGGGGSIGGGGGNSGTPAGVYTLTVTGTSGSGASALSHSVSITLKVS